VNNPNFHKGYNKKFNSQSYRTVKSDKNVVANLHNQNSFNNKNDFNNMNEQFRPPNMNKVWRNNHNFNNQMGNMNMNMGMNMNMNMNNPYNANQFVGPKFRSSENYSKIKNQAGGSRKNLPIKEEHNMHHRRNDENNDEDEDENYYSSDHSDMEEEQNDDPSKEKVSIYVCVKLFDKEETIRIGQNDDVLSVANKFIAKNRLNENLAKPISAKIKLALNTLEFVFDQRISKYDVHSLSEVQNYYKKSKIVHEQSSGNDLIDTCDENLIEHEISCITDFGAYEEIIDSILPSAEEIKICERLNVSS
jgi:hypothetical protein